MNGERLYLEKSDDSRNESFDNGSFTKSIITKNDFDFFNIMETPKEKISFRKNNFAFMKKRGIDSKDYKDIFELNSFLSNGEDNSSFNNNDLLFDSGKFETFLIEKDNKKVSNFPIINNNKKCLSSKQEKIFEITKSQALNNKISITSCTKSKEKVNEIKSLIKKNILFKVSTSSDLEKINHSNTKLGRKKKFSNESSKHTKKSRDNIIRKVKNHFIHSLLDYINKKFRIYNVKFKRIIPDFTRTIDKISNIKWLNTKIKDFFFSDVSIRVKDFDLYHNRKLIQKIYKENIESDVIQILEKNIKEMWMVFLSNANEEHEGFECIDEDILKMKEETDSFKEEYKKVALNYENIMDGILPRKRTKHPGNSRRIA